MGIKKILEEKSQHNVKETKSDVIDFGQLRMNHWRNQPAAHFMGHEGFLHTILGHIGNMVPSVLQKGRANPTAGEPAHSIGDTVVGNLVTCPECELELPSCDVIVCATCPKLRWCHDCHQKVLKSQENRATSPANNPSCLTCL